MAPAPIWPGSFLSTSWPFFFFSSLEVSFSLSALPLNNEELVEGENYLERRRHHVQEPITPS